MEVHVDKGMRHNQKISLRGEGNQLPDHTNGDVIFVIKMKPHPRFQRGSGRARGGRDESDLMIELDINLIQALTGFALPITHLDGRLLLIKSQPNQIIRPGIHLSLMFRTSRWRRLTIFDSPPLMFRGYQRSVRRRHAHVKATVRQRNSHT